MKCLKCQNEIIDSSKYCPFCGIKIKEIILEKIHTCQKCNKNISPNSVYCEFCGFKIQSDSGTIIQVGKNSKKENNDDNFFFQILFKRLAGLLLVIITAIFIIYQVVGTKTDTKNSNTDNKFIFKNKKLTSSLARINVGAKLYFKEDMQYFGIIIGTDEEFRYDEKQKIVIIVDQKCKVWRIIKNIITEKYLVDANETTDEKKNNLLELLEQCPALKKYF